MGSSPAKDDALYSAVANNDFPRFCELVVHRDPAAPLAFSADQDSEAAPTILHLLCRFSRLAMIQTLFALYPNAPIDAVDDFGDTPLTLAVKSRNPVLIAVLLQRGANPCYHNPFDSSDSPLHYAVFHCEVDIVKVILDAGGGVNARNDHGMTPLMYAAQKGRMDVWQLLLTRGGDPCLIDARGVSAKQYALIAGMELPLMDDTGKEGTCDSLCVEDIKGHKLQATESAVSERTFTDVQIDTRGKTGWMSCLRGE